MPLKFNHQHLPPEKGGNPPNMICDPSPHWYISYNPSSADYGSVTTAIVLGQMEYFLVLNGDHRKALSDVIEDKPEKPKRGMQTRLGRVLQYVRDNRKMLSTFSDPIL
jgi:hypothetical protein